MLVLADWEKCACIIHRDAGTSGRARARAHCSHGEIHRKKIREKSQRKKNIIELCFALLLSFFLRYLSSHVFLCKTRPALLLVRLQYVFHSRCSTSTYTILFSLVAQFLLHKIAKHRSSDCVSKLCALLKLLCTRSIRMDTKTRLFLLFCFSHCNVTLYYRELQSH